MKCLCFLGEHCNTVPVIFLTKDKNVIYTVAEKYTVNIFLSHLFILVY